MRALKGRNARRIGLPRIIEENFIRQDGQAANGRKLLESQPLVALQIRTCGVVWVHHHNGSCPLVDARFQGADVDAPAQLLGQGVLADLDALEFGQTLEERVGRPGREYVVARITEQLEEPGVGFAGAAGEDDVTRVRRGALPGVPFGDGLARGWQTVRCRFVAKRGRILERGEDLLARIGQVDARGVRDSEIDQRRPGGPEGVESGAEPVGLQAGGRAPGEQARPPPRPDCGVLPSPGF